MSLTLKVSAYRGIPPTQEVSVCFDAQGGTIGRAMNNDLVLPDPDQEVSPHHARIAYKEGHYYLTDSSLAGTYFNNGAIPLHDDTIQLADGDQLTLGSYELAVHIRKEEVESVLSSIDVVTNQPVADEEDIIPSIQTKDEFDLENWIGEGTLLKTTLPQAGIDDDKKPFEGMRDSASCHEKDEPPSLSSEKAEEIPQDFNSEKFFKLAEIGEELNFSPASEISVAQSAGPSELSTMVTFSPYMSSAQLADRFCRSASKAATLKLLAERTEAPAGPSEEAAKQNAISHHGSSRDPRQLYAEVFQNFLEGACLNDSRFFEEDEIPEMMRTLGAAFRAMVDGMMSTLREQAAFKNPSKVSSITSQPTHKNPLKFSVTVEEALKLLLVKHPPRYLDAEQAIREGFADIMNHQLTVSAGIQAALDELLQRFDRQNSKKECEDRLKGNSQT